MRPLVAAVAAVAFLLSAVLPWATATGTTVNLLFVPLAGNGSAALEIVKNATKTLFTPQTGITINIDMATAEVEYGTLVQLYLSSNDTSYDLYTLDVIWPGDFAKYLLDVGSYFTPEDRAAQLPAVWDADYVSGKGQVAIPFNVDLGLFYYRSDLLKKYNFSGPPQTWDEMEHMARTVTAGEPDVDGFIGQFSSYEGLTCNIAEWLKSYNVSNTVDMYNGLNLNNNASMDALRRAYNWFQNGVTPKFALESIEATATARWTAGKLLFLRNWEYVTSLTPDPGVNFTFGVAPMPGATRELRGASTLGGWHFGVSSSTSNVTASIAALKFLTSQAVQRPLALAGLTFPTIQSLYDDPELCAVVGFCDVVKELALVARPSAKTAPHYLEVSEVLYNTVTAYFANKISLEMAVQQIYIGSMKVAGTYQAYALSGCGILLCIMIVMLVQYHHDEKVIKAASPVFLIIIALGVILGFATTFFYVGQPTKTTCIIQPWLLVFSFCVTNSAMISNAWRVYRVLGNTKRQSDQQLSTWYLLRNMGAVSLLEAVVLIVWTVADPPVPSSIFVSDDKAFMSCASKSHGTVFTAVLLCMNGLMMAFGTWLAYETRHIDAKYSGSGWIAIIMYNTFIWSTIAVSKRTGILAVAISLTAVTGNKFQVSLVYLNQLGAIATFSIRSAAILVSCFGVLAFTFGPKLKDIYFPDESIESPNMSRMTDSSSTRRKDGDKTTVIADRMESVKAYCRSGRSEMFMGTWMKCRVFFIEAVGLSLLVVAPRDAQESQERKGRGHCIPLIEDRATLVRCSKGGVWERGSQHDFVVLVKLADQMLYEFEFEHQNELTFFLTSLGFGGSKHDV
ncbi:hypothetical protein HK101_003325, partial [Irineochytrium annulatum]